MGARAHMLLPRSKQIEPLVSSRERRAVFEPPPERLGGCHGLEQLNASDLGSAKTACKGELISVSSLAYGDVHPESKSQKGLIRVARQARYRPILRLPCCE